MFHIGNFSRIQTANWLDQLFIVNISTSISHWNLSNQMISMNGSNLNIHKGIYHIINE